MQLPFPGSFVQNGEEPYYRVRRLQAVVDAAILVTMKSIVKSKSVEAALI